MGRNISQKMYATTHITSDETFEVPAGVTSLELLGYVWTPRIKAGKISGAITSAGDVYAWGKNNNGSVADGTLVSKSSPVMIVGGMKFKALVGGHDPHYHSLAIDFDGNAYAWGVNGRGQLGNGANFDESSPVLVLGGHKWKKVAVDSELSFGITVEGDLYGWGNNFAGQLGDGTLVGKSTPVLLASGIKFKQVYSAGSASPLALSEDGDLYSWGYNTNGEVGDGTTTNKSTPTLVIGGKKWTVATGEDQKYAIDTNGDLYSWGSGTPLATDSSPVLVSAPELVDIVKMESSNGDQGKAFFALSKDGVLWSWGGTVAHTGRSGNGEIRSVTAEHGIRFIDVAAGEGVGMGLSTDGTLYSWGENFDGQLGDGGNADSYQSPVNVVGPNVWSNIDREFAIRSEVKVIPGESYLVGELSSLVGSSDVLLIRYNS